MNNKRKTIGLVFLILGISLIISIKFTQIGLLAVPSFTFLVVGGTILLEEFGIIKSSLMDSVGIK